LTGGLRLWAPSVYSSTADDLSLCL